MLQINIPAKLNLLSHIKRKSRHQLTVEMPAMHDDGAGHMLGHMYVDPLFNNARSQRHVSWLYPGIEPPF
jgi:hypothetical protein